MKMIANLVYLRQCPKICQSVGKFSTAVSFKPNDDDFEKARPFEEMPGLNKFQLITRFLVGGKYHGMPLSEIQSSLRSEFGDFYRLPGIFGQTANVTTFNADDVEFIHRNEGVYPYRRGLESLAYFRKEIKSDVYSVGGLIVDQGSDWHTMRTAVNPILMKPQIVKSYIPLIDGIVYDFMKNIPEIADANGEMPANFNDFVNRFSLESITAIALEKRLGLLDFNIKNELGLRISKAVRKILTMGLEFELHPSIWRLYQTKRFKELIAAYDELSEMSAKIINEAKERYASGTATTVDGQEEGVLFKLLQKDERFATVMAFDMIFGGIDTTTSALCFIMYCLGKNPEKQERLRRELMQVMPSKDTPLNGENMKNMPYLRAVIKEALRLFPPAGVNMRRTSSNIVFRGYQIPKNVDLIMGMQIIYKDKKYYESSAEFVPERWLRHQAEEKDVCSHALKQSHPFSFLPFGFGVRFCVGKRIAEMELEVFISRLLRNYKIEWNHADIRMKATMVNMPDGELRFKFVKL